MKNKDLFDFKNALTEIIDENYVGIEFAFKVIKNKKVVEERISEIQELAKALPEYLEFDKKRVDLLREYSTNENGELMTKDLGNGHIEYLIQSINLDKFKTEFEKLKLEFKDVILKQEEKQKDLDNYLNKESDISFITIKQSILPEFIKPKHLETLYDLIEEEN